MNRLLLFAAVLTVAIGFPLAQTQIEQFTTVRVLSQLGVRINPGTSLSVLHARGATTTAGNYGLFVDDSATAPLLTVENNGNIQLTKTGGVISIPGRVNSATQQPGFLAYMTTDVAVGTNASQVIPMNVELYDTASNLVGGTFTAPVTGQYLMCGTVTWESSAATILTMYLVGTWATVSLQLYRYVAPGTTVKETGGGCGVIPMTATQTAFLQFTTGTGGGATIHGLDGLHDGGAVTWFSGRLLP